MFYQVVLTPKRPEKKKVEKQEQPEEIEILSLAPFTSTPKLCFDDVKVGCTVNKKICIRNPSNADIKLYLEKFPPPERNVCFNWSELVITACNEEMLVITWQPLVPGAWRDVLQLWDRNRIRRDIPIAFKSFQPKEAKKKKIGVKLKNIKSPECRKARKSPIKKLATSTVSRAPLQSNTIIPSINFSSPPIRRATFKVDNKENFPKAHNLPLQATNSTYTLIKHNNSQESSSILEKSKIIEDNFDDSLEMPAGMAIKSDIPYTPLVSAAKKENSSFQHLTFTPETPLGQQQRSYTCSTEEKSFGNSFNKKWRNVSSETYVKEKDISAETYVIKANLSGGTYVKDTSIGDLASLQLSPHLSPNPTINTTSSFSDLKISPIVTQPLSLYVPNTHLENISEESSIETTPMKHKIAMNKIKPKTNLAFEVSPAKKQKRSPIKRLSTAYSKKPLHLKGFIMKTRSAPAITTTIIKTISSKTTNMHNPDMFYNDFCNPYILAETSGVDPFMAVTLYYDPRWMDEQILRFKNWMNVLLIPPEDLASNANTHVDVAKLWQECRNKEVEKAPTKEQVSNKYNQSHLLQSLRRNAMKLFRSPEMIAVLSKCNGMVENNRLTIRVDRNIHQDIGLQKEILSLLFCYNPLWLRIGLETVFSVHIHLRSNSDIVGLTSFLSKHFFNKPYLLKKYKSKSAPSYCTEVKKEAAKKFLSLVFFLDQAKTQKLIPYDPCLFMKNAPHKESKEILVRFASSVFHAIGDVMKPLRIVNYTLHHKQTYIHEYEYGVEDLGQDLKDGVRLTRVMETILLEPNLTDLLRVPAISRLQKIHNVKLAFDALKKANYTIESNIEPKDIVEGHREKTLSFLWQIIYKFQSPRFTKAVITVQLWWRSPKVQAKLQLFKEERRKEDDAAKRIQIWFKRQQTRVKLQRIIPCISELIQNERRQKAAIKIQTAYRMIRCRRIYLQLYQSTLLMQRCFRRWYNTTILSQKRHNAAIVLQNAIRSYVQRRHYLKMKQAVFVISEFYSATMQTAQQRAIYLKVREAVVFIQQKLRATLMMRQTRDEFLQLKTTACLIQRKYRATLLMRKERKQFLMLKEATIIVQQTFRANRDMNRLTLEYSMLKNAALTLQRRFRAKQAMIQQKNDYLLSRKSIITIQTWFRACQFMRFERTNYLELRQSVIFTQRKFRANSAMKSQREKFLELRRNVVNVQRRFRANRAMKQQQKEFSLLKEHVIKLQQRFRANIVAKKTRHDYLKLKDAVRMVENCHEAKQYRNKFVLLKKSVILVQRRFRALVLQRKYRNDYLLLKKAVQIIEKRYSALQLQRTQRCSYLNILRAIIFTQRQFRAKLLMRTERQRFLLLKNSALKIQRFYKGFKLMQQARAEKCKKLTAIVTIQRRLRATVDMQMQRARFKITLQSITKIQVWYRSVTLMRFRRFSYQRLRNAAIVIQRRFRANKLMQQQRREFLTLRGCVQCVQRHFRANLRMKQERLSYLQLHDAAIVVQQKFRANLIAKKVRAKYLRLKNAVDVIATRYLAQKDMKTTRDNYLKIMSSVILIQRRYRMQQLARKIYLKLKQAVLVLEVYYEAKLAMRRQRRNYTKTLSAIIFIQRKFRAQLAMKRQRQQYLLNRQSIIKIQQYYKGFKLMQQEKRVRFAKLKAVLLLQVWGRGYLARETFKALNTPEMIEERRQEKARKLSAMKIQAAWRGFLTRSQQSQEIADICKRAAIVNSNARPEDTLKNRTNRNMRIIISGSATMLQVINSLEDLERSTRLCQVSCVSIGKKICEELYGILSSSSQSRTDIEASSVAVGILVNVAKYQQLAVYAWKPEHLPGVIQRMLHSCDKENALYLKLLTLLWVFGHDDKYREEILQLPSFESQMTKMLQMCERQQKMVTRSYKSKTVSVFALYDTLPLPTVKPDWGLDYVHAPHIFANSLHGIRALCQLFNV